MKGNEDNDMLGKLVRVIVDRPLGSCHPRYENLLYPVNYGYVSGVVAGDGEEQDAYILGVYEPIAEFVGHVIAIAHRLDDIEDKWVVAPLNISFTKEEIEKKIHFQEQFFQTEIIM